MRYTPRPHGRISPRTARSWLAAPGAGSSHARPRALRRGLRAQAGRRHHVLLGAGRIRARVRSAWTAGRAPVGARAPAHLRPRRGGQRRSHRARSGHSTQAWLLAAVTGVDAIRPDKPLPALGIETPDDRTLVLHLARRDVL